MISPLLNLLSRARKARAAAVVRSVAGLPIGAANRRGTVLVLVIGALALISVITLIYATIGQSDRRQAAVNQVHTDIRAAADAAASFAAQKIADGGLALAVAGSYTSAAGNEEPVLVRPSADYPSTDPWRISVLPAGTPAGSPLRERRFSPDGSYETLWTLGGVDQRIPSTPFLASTQPVSLIDATPNIMAGHDWLHISNLAPDGRFVNLWNLAPVVNNQRFSSFRAASTLTVSGSGNATAPLAPNDPSLQPDPLAQPPRSTSYMSFNLSLYDQAGNPTFNLDFGGVADVNRPAHWDSRQQFLYRPAAGPMYFSGIVASGGNPNSPGSAYYPPYQYCDADGDGFFDSRWFELVDASDPNNPLSLLPKDDRFRWFVAARVMDLSALVNVNTATSFDSQGTPTAAQAALFGATPADVDLRRLLTMDDLYRRYSMGAAALGYGALEQPQIPGPEDYSGYTRPVARNVGDRGYRALRLALASASESVYPAGFALGNPVSMWRDDRYSYYADLGGQSEAGYSRVGGVQRYDHSARFTAADLKELLTYWMANNPGSTSRLEQTVDGRFDAANGGNAPNFGPLRSNRGEAVERGGIDNQNQAGAALPLGDGRADLDAMIRSVFDVRHYITPLSWSRPLRSGVIPPPDATTGLSWNHVLGVGVDQKVDTIGGLVAATDSTVNQQDPSKLFKGYAQALLPYGWVRGTSPTSASVWDPASRLATLSFGGNAELALRIAAHMTANLIDAYDTDNAPHAFTLLIDENQRRNIDRNLGGANADRFPWWNERGYRPSPPQTPSFPGQLDLNQNLTNPVNLAHTTSGAAPLDPPTAASMGAVNIYGIEAQPFITEVVSFFVYSDTPSAAVSPSPMPPGDDETGGLPMPPYPHNGITIDGSLTSPDNLGQVIAFQITNPFDVDIELTKTDPSGAQNPVLDNEYSDYYIQFGGDMAAGGTLYKLAGVVEGASDLQPITLHKGESRVFYCLSDSLANIQAKWHNEYPAIAADAVERFIWNQLSITPAPGAPYTGSEHHLGDMRAKPVRIKRMDPASGKTREPNATPADHDLFGGTSAANKQVMLWRVMHSTPADPEQPVGMPSPNVRSNDMLVDHMRDPGAPGNPAQATLDRRLPFSNQEVGSTIVAPDGQGDNTGFTIAMWGSLKRRNDPGIGGTTPRGAIPAYCVEAKWGTGSQLFNPSDVVSANPNSLSKSDFTGPSPVNADNKFKDFVQRTSIETDRGGPPYQFTGVIVKTIAQQPSEWLTGQPNNPPMPLNLDMPARKYEAIYPVAHLNNKRFRAQIDPAGGGPTISTLRLADLLLPMGIGPMCDPGIGNGTMDPDAWLTLSEALGLALNYSNPGPATPGWGLYDKIGDSQAGVLDRGNLALDRGAPYEDANPTMPHTYEGPGSMPAGNDQIRWPGIPLSLNILNVFTVNEAQFGGLDQPTQGLININTAPLAVLNTIPLLSPTTEPNVWTAWKSDYGATGAGKVPEAPMSPTPDPADTTSADVASGILAYRARQLTDSTNATFPFQDREGRVVSFTDLANGGSPFNTLVRDGRTQTTKIPAQREIEGFATPGEILTIVDRTGPGNSPGLTRIVARGDQIDGLGLDSAASGIIGVNTTLFKDPATGTFRVDDVPDDYAEKLAVAQAALGSITVRSDLFAVWFVVQGYQKSDTEGLGVNDVLKPSVAKRFLMVVDRSNVIRKGEKPRILFLTELPM